LQYSAAAAALDAARNAKVESNRRSLTATVTMKTQLKRGRKAVRLLDAILKPRLAGNPQLLAAWQSATRVRPTSAATASDASVVVVSAREGRVRERPQHPVSALDIGCCIGTLAR
jgi:hypothetical protein